MKLAATAAVVALLSFSACSNQSAMNTPTRTVTVTMRDLAFEPNAISMRVDEHMRVAFQNSGGQVHDFTMPDMPMQGMTMAGGMTSGEHGRSANGAAMHMAFEAGKGGEATFTPTKAGQYTYYCTVAGHREAGMHGVIDVQ